MEKGRNDTCRGFRSESLRIRSAMPREGARTCEQLGLAATEALLSINFLPNAVYEPRACIRLTLETARRLDFPLEKIIFEFTKTKPSTPTT